MFPVLHLGPVGCFGDLNLGIGSFRLATILAESYNVCVRFDGERQARHPRQSFPIVLQATTAQLLCSRISSPPGHSSNPPSVFPPTGTNGHHRSGVYSYPSTLVYYSIIIVCSALPWPGQRGQPVIFASHLARPNVAHCAVQHAHSSPSPYLRSSNSPTSSSRASALHGLWRTTSRSPWHTPSPSALRGIPRRLLEIRREEPNKQSAMCAMP